MKHWFYLFLLYLSFMALQGCQPSGPSSNQEQIAAPDNNNEPATTISIDLPSIKSRGELVAITAFNSTSYFIYKGRPMGYEYELLEKLANELGLKVRVKVARNVDQMVEMLKNGEGDLIAYAMTITKDRKEEIAFTDHHNIVEQVLVQRRPDNWRKMRSVKLEKMMVRSVIDLINKPIYVNEESSYYKRLYNLSEELGEDLDIRTVDSTRSTEDLIKLVATGEISYTVADKNIAQVNSTYYTNLDIKTPVSFPQRVAWAVRKDSPQLLESINNWISRMKKETDFYVIYNKYFKNTRRQNKRIKSDYHSHTGYKISPYDALIKEQAQQLGWDWRLLASQVYQESRFDRKSESWAGAVGLLQLMPETAQRFGIRNPKNPRESLEGGAKFLAYLKKIFQDVPDSLTRLKFVLASYNAGNGHVTDAIKLAEKYGADPYKWDDNVERYLLLKSKREYFSDPVCKFGYCRGEEPVNYVKEILDRYEHYKLLIRE